MRGRGWKGAVLLCAAGAAGLALVPAAGASGSRVPCAEFFEAVSERPVAEATPLDPGITGAFAILRRPAGPEDQIPVFNSLNEDIGSRLRSYLPAYIRQLAREPGGDRYFLIPGFERSLFPPPRCLPAHVPRPPVRLVEEQRKREGTPVYCIENVGPHRFEYAQSACAPFAAVQTGARLLELEQSTSEVLELVPDGVATVRLRYVGGEVITAPATGNAFGFTPPQRLIREAQRRLRPLRRKLLGELRAHHRHALGPLLRRERAIYDELRPRTIEWIGAGGLLLRSFQPKEEASGFAGTVLGGIVISSG